MRKHHFFNVCKGFYVYLYYKYKTFCDKIEKGYC